MDATSTLWNIIDRPLAYHSTPQTNFTQSVAVTGPGFSALQIPVSWQANPCIHNPNLLEQLVASCQKVLHGVNASPEALQLYQGYIPHPPLPHEIDLEPCIQSHLNLCWLAGARVIIVVISVCSSLNLNQIPTYDDMLRYNLFSKLCTLHTAGFLHGDVQPQNTIIADNGVVCLIDLSEASAHH